ncbi:UNVERIFIED_CONTAM: hypothetical protein Sangu_1559500 [Sesamum angustifolium]|uniref:Uncharacterized protein n=1 Tax=Sesamum angustifolium TaxID=2727405 RepID=A0AAW2MTI1_9LAMI
MVQAQMRMPHSEWAHMMVETVAMLPKQLKNQWQVMEQPGHDHDYSSSTYTSKYELKQSLHL